jgi:hypothetical protein
MKSTRFVYALLLATVFGSFPAYGDDSLSGSLGSDSSPSSTSQARQSELSQAKRETLGLSVGLETVTVSYQEPGIMSESGAFSGFDVGYDLALSGGYSFHFEGEYLTGQVNYDGSVSSYDAETQITTVTPMTSGGNDSLANFRATFVNEQVFTRMTKVSYYLGTAYRDLFDKIDGVGSYRRNIDYIYLPTGATFTFAPNDHWSFSQTNEFDIFLTGSATSYLSDANSNDPNVTNKQNGGYGFRISASAKRDFEKYALRLQSYLQYWQIDASQSVRATLQQQRGPVEETLIEPSNRSTMYGINLSVEL